MKITHYFIVLICLFFCRIPFCEAGQFINLGFDEANYSGNPMDTQSHGLVSDLLPGWRLFYGTNEQFVVGFNSTPLGGGGGYYSTIFNRYWGAPEGEYAFKASTPEGAPSWKLEQQGDVPKGAKMLAYRGNLWTVAVNGNVIPLLITGPNVYNLTNVVFYDISAWSGKSVTLDFISPNTSPDPFSKGGFGQIDSIAFIVPEPLFVENDFNADGAPDVVFEHQDGFVGVWFMNKGPDLISPSFFNPEAVADPRWHIVGNANFTKTNKTDLLFQHEDGSLAVWSMDGTNLVSAALLNPSQPGDAWKVVGTGDMNHDGKKDILFQHTDGTLGVWFMDGINLVAGALLNPSKPGEAGWRVVGTAALSSVGNTDLIFQHSDGTLAAWYMNGINLVQGVLLNPSSPGEAGWRVATTLDLNADGKTDLLFQHDDGTAAVWLMDGINLISGHLLNPEDPGTGWRIAGPR